MAILAYFLLKSFIYQGINMLVSKLKLVILAWESVGLTCFWREPRVANGGTAVFGTFSCWVRFFDFTSPKVVAGS